jgi:hypothetical protein
MANLRAPDSPCLFRAAQLSGESLILGDLDVFDAIALGGERNYGFGRVGQVPLAEELRATVSNGWSDDPEAEISLQSTRPLRAHLPYQPEQIFKGEIEIVAGREYRAHNEGSTFQGAGAQISTVGYCFVPGTRLRKVNRPVRLEPWGLLEWT